MLKELRCDNFFEGLDHVKTIIFNDSLNIILGDSKGCNSIGKTSILLIIDYVFGGDDYLKKSKELIERIGPQSYRFVFEFECTRYIFSRDTSCPKIILQYDSNNNIQAQWSIEKYRKWLAIMYSLENFDITLRGCIGRFFRVYGRDSLDEKRPLSAATKAKESQNVIDFLKLMDYYKTIAELQNKVASRENEKMAYSAAQRFNIIGKLTKANQKKIEDELITLEKQKSALLESSMFGKIKLDENITSQVLELALKLKNKIYETESLKSRLKRDEERIGKESPINLRMLQELSTFFPNMNYKSIQETEEFHYSLENELKSLIATDRENLKASISMNEELIKIYRNQITTLDDNSIYKIENLEEYATLISSINEKSKWMKIYNHLEFLKEDIQTLKNLCLEQKEASLHTCSQIINAEIENLFCTVFDHKKTPPKLSFPNSNQYLYNTPKDTGAGAAFIGLILFDIAMIRHSILPSFIHDTNIHKNISPESFEKIIPLYTKTEKQIFVAIDNYHSFSDDTKRILRDNCVVSLSRDKLLFGKRLVLK